MAQMIPLPAPSGRSSASMEARRYQGKHLWWHDAIIDAMLAHPQWTKKQIAEHLNCTPAIIYMITNSDLFAARFEQRRQEFNRIHDQAVVVGLNRVAESALDLIGQVLAKKGDTVPLPQLVDLADKTLNRLGYGVKPAAPAAPVQVNVGGASVSVSADAIMEARLALRRSEQAKLVEGPATAGGSAISRFAAEGPEGTARHAPEGRPQLANLTEGESEPIVTYERNDCHALPPPMVEAGASVIELEVESKVPAALFLGDCGADESDL